MKDVFGASGWGGVTTGVVAVAAMAVCAASTVVFFKGRGIKGAAAAMMMGMRPRSGPGYSRVSTAENDDFALADQLLEDDDIDPSNI